MNNGRILFLIVFFIKLFEKMYFYVKIIEMRKYLFVLIIPFLFCACGKKNPIVFTKQSDLSEVHISLDTNGTFVYNASSKVGAVFNETGTYTIEDTLLILRFTYESYDYLCSTVPLPNDTSLIMHYKGKTILYPTIRKIPEVGLDMTHEELIDSILTRYQRSDFEKDLGTRLFVLESGDMSLLYTGTWKISPYYDSFLKD